MKPELLNHFQNPPQGGNGRGVATQSAMSESKGIPSGADAQGDLRSFFNSGVDSAGRNVVQAGRAGQPEMRNYVPGRYREPHEHDANELQAYDFESAHDNDGRPKVMTGPVLPAVAAPKPTLDPPAVTVRHDGKPANPFHPRPRKT